MMKILRATCMVFLLSSFSYAGKGQTLPNLKTNSFTGMPQFEQSGEIIVIFDNLSVKQLQDLEACFTKVEGIRNSGSCQNLNCYYFNYDKQLYRTDESAFEALLFATKKYVPILKTGTSAQVIKMCNNL